MKYFLPKGTRDFSTNELIKRNFIIKIIQKNFKLFGFYPLETSSFEKKSTLDGKYGEEGESLIFKLLHSGDTLKKGLSNFLNKINNDKIKNLSLLTNFFSNKALRYDLTVPLVRYIVMNKNKIIFPFRRYQMQPVWRAENPQKGRFREFFQCDADIISSFISLWDEIELIKLCDFIFNELNLPVIIYINHIEILKGLVKIYGIKESLWKDFIISLDKWKKIGKNLVKKEMLQKGISITSFERISDLLEKEKNFLEIKNFLTSKFKSIKNKIGEKSIKDLSIVYETIKNISLKKIKIEWSLSLARGINYYTGIIWEIVPINNKNTKYSYSIGGGGRYSRLTKLFGMENISGLGLSFGLDRIYLTMEKENLFKNSIFFPSKILFINFGYEESLYTYKLMNILREKGISNQLYPNNIKIHKQFKYANDNKIPFAIIIGKNEIINNKIKIKNLKTRIEKEYNDINDLIKYINMY
ncbi:histidine--tRNA ligase [Blattabacterium cuenoti]|uniref:histidine--tRNA ligase n=1 Tax=Blattabacterium cuenoti TaxID=1653831 RepID=UPI00163BA7B8|nr:histidine--tRNA ligase [Blattabacterium cuenoti]